MPNFDRNIYGAVLNSGQQHLACTIILDTSSSMSSSISQLKDALRELKSALDDDPRARSTVDLCVITFDSSARVAMPFCAVPYFEVPELTANGMTAMHQAVDLALREDRSRKDQYAQSGTGHYRSWFFLLTDGGSNDEDNGAFERLLQAQKAGSVTFFGVGIGEGADLQQIASLSVTNGVITASRETFKNAFSWLSASISKVTQSTSGDKINLDNPASFDGLNYQQIPITT